MKQNQTLSFSFKRMFFFSRNKEWKRVTPARCHFAEITAVCSFLHLRVDVMRWILCLLLTLTISRGAKASWAVTEKREYVTGDHLHIFRVHDEAVFEGLKHAFERDEDVLVERQRGRESLLERGESLLYLHPLAKDRSCLLPPPVAPKRVQSSSAVRTVEGALDWANSMCGKERALDGSLSSLGQVIQDRMHHSKLYSPSSETKAQCERVSSREMGERFKSDFWVPQRPVVITDYFSPPSSNELLSKLDESADVNVGVKLSDSEDFEGVEALLLWVSTTTEDIFDIPEVVSEQLMSTELVVVRAAHEQLSLGETLDLLLSRGGNNSTTRAYVEYHRLKESGAIMQGLAPPLPAWLQELLPAKDRGEPYLWLGDGRTVGKVHFDPYDNVLAMLEGTKTFRLVPSGSLPEGHLREGELKATWDKNLEHYRVHRGQLSESTSLVHSTTRTLDHEQAMECTVAAGEALFVPSYWWHEVKSHPSDAGLNMAINYWFPPLYTKEFPCTECTKVFNHRVYREVVEASYFRPK